jgi:hypothetical protein
MNSRLIAVEKQTTSISDNITLLMAHLQVPSHSKQKVPCDNLDQEDSYAMELVVLSNPSTSLSSRTRGDTCF